MKNEDVSQKEMKTENYVILEIVDHTVSKFVY